MICGKIKNSIFVVNCIVTGDNCSSPCKWGEGSVVCCTTLHGYRGSCGIGFESYCAGCSVVFSGNRIEEIITFDCDGAIAVIYNCSISVVCRVGTALKVIVTDCDGVKTIDGFVVIGGSNFHGLSVSSFFLDFDVRSNCGGFVDSLSSVDLLHCGCRCGS